VVLEPQPDAAINEENFIYSVKVGGFLRKRDIYDCELESE
jgi:hypothetical protein